MIGWESTQDLGFAMLLLLTACIPAPEPTGLGDDVAELQAQLAQLQSTLAETQSALSTAQAALETQQAQLDALTQASADAVRVLRQSDTLDVPAEYATIHEALDALDGWHIAREATVTIQVDRGDYVYDTAVVVNHPDGDRIHIVGDPGNPTAVKLSFISSDGVRVSHGRALGMLDGFVIEGDGTESKSGVIAEDNATLEIGDHLVVQGFGGPGYYAYRGGVLLHPDSGSGEGPISQANDTGFQAAMGGLLYVYNAQAMDNSSRGYYAGFASLLNAPYSVASGAESDGYVAELHSLMRAEGAIATVSGDYGARVSYNSTLDGNSLQVSEYATHGISIYAGSYSRLSDATVGPGSDAEDSVEIGLHISGGSFAHVSDATISDNSSYGLEVRTGSGALRTRTTFSNNNGTGDDYVPTPFVGEYEGSYVY